MVGMKKFSKSYRLQSDSVAEITRAFEEATFKLSETLKFDGRKLRPGPLLNAIAVHFLHMSEADREEFGRFALAQLECFLAETDEEREKAEERLSLVLPKEDAEATDKPEGKNVEQPTRQPKVGHSVDTKRPRRKGAAG